jgi:actin-related protein 8
MVGKKSGKALLREEGLERTDNQMGVTSWPDVNPINQKNYYTEFLKRDDQILPYRLQQEERRNRLTTNAKNRDRELAQTGLGDLATIDPDMDLADEVGLDESTVPSQERLGSKIIVIHPGSQNLRIGLANDSLPKTVPMCIARRSVVCESEDGDGEPRPKRQKTKDSSKTAPEKMFGPGVSGSIILTLRKD